MREGVLTAVAEAVAEGEAAELAEAVGERAGFTEAAADAVPSTKEGEAVPEGEVVEVALAEPVTVGEAVWLEETLAQAEAVSVACAVPVAAPAPRLGVCRAVGAPVEEVLAVGVSLRCALALPPPAVVGLAVPLGDGVPSGLLRVTVAVAVAVTHTVDEAEREPVCVPAALSVMEPPGLGEPVLLCEAEPVAEGVAQAVAVAETVSDTVPVTLTLLVPVSVAAEEREELDEAETLADPLTEARKEGVGVTAVLAVTEALGLSRPLEETEAVGLLLGLTRGLWLSSALALAVVAPAAAAQRQARRIRSMRRSSKGGRGRGARWAQIQRTATVGG